MALRYTTVTPNPRQDKHPGRQSLSLNVVLVTEQTPLADKGRLEWCLVPTEPVAGAAAAREIARTCTVRWRVEELHLTLKSGCRIESHQFDSGEPIGKVVVMLSAVASFWLLLSYLARTEPELPVTLVLDEASERVLRGYARAVHRRRSSEPLTLREAVAPLGRLGGHMGRKCDGPVGVRTLWRGWRDLQGMLLGAAVAAPDNYG